MTEKGTCDQVSVCEPVPDPTASHDAPPMEFALLESRDGFPEGGASAATLRLVGRALVEANVQATVLLPKPNLPPGAKENSPSGSYMGVRFEYTCGTTRTSANFFRRRFDALRGFTTLWLRLIQKRFEHAPNGFCVYLYGEAPSLCLPVLILGKIFRFPVIVELCEWNAAFPGANWLSNWYHRVRIRFADGVLAISKDLERKAAVLLPASRKRNVLLHSILVDVNEAAGERSGSEMKIIDVPYVLWCGYIKGYLESVLWLIRCCALAAKHAQDLNLVIVGNLSEELRSRLLSEARAAGFPDTHLILTGYVSREELWNLYSGAVALLAPLDSSERSQARFPWKIAEYLAAGRPVITNEVGEIPRYFTDGENALVARPEDERDFASRIELVVKNRALADRIGAAGHQLALQQFHYAGFGENLLRFANTLSVRGQSDLSRERRPLSSSSFPRRSSEK